MTFIRKHKFIIIVSTICIVALLIIAAILTQVLSEDKNDKYDGRIDNIENFRIADSRVDDIKNKVLEDENVNEVTFRLDGKLIKIFIEVKKDTDELSVGNMLNIIIDNFTDDEKNYYDFQVFVICEEKQQSYPMIAYKHRNNQLFTITKKEGSNDEE